MNRTYKFLPALLLCAAVSCAPRSKDADLIRYQVWHDYYEQCVPKDFTVLGEPDFEGYTNDFMLLGIPGADVDHFAARLEGPMEFPESGCYKIYFISDDGGLLFIDDELVINHDGRHGISVRTDSLHIDKGRHNVRIDYFNNDKALKIELLYSVNGGSLKRAFTLGDATPSFVRPQIREAYRRYSAWKGSDETIVFPIFTDVHSSGREVYKHIGYLAENGGAFNFDFMVNLGDIGLNDPLTSGMKAYAGEIIDLTRREMAKFDGVFLYSAGNHDWDGGEGTGIGSVRLYEWFQKPSEARAGGNLHIVPGKCYGWYDIPEKNTRFIILNSEGTEHVGMIYIFDDEQLGWLRKLLSETPEGMNIVLFSHQCPHLGGRWLTGSGLTYSPGSEALMSILSEFKASGSRIMGLFCGDSHVNALLEKEGVTYFISQGYGIDDGTCQMQREIQKNIKYNYTRTFCVDVIAIKPATGEIRSFRIGAGGSDMDYAIAG